MVGFAIFLCVVLLLNVVSLMINKIFFSNELEGISPYGEMVNVNGENMHVYSMGDGDQTVVLLPGFSVPLPSADFAPLMRKLSKKYTVVCIEYFGVGFSDQTQSPRTNESYTQEIRTALSLSGFAPPYILMPHSGSGIYSEYYATQYPDEVSGIIMLDTTSSAKVEAAIPKFVYQLGKVQQAIGLGRFINPLVVSSVLSIKQESGYTQQEVDDYTKYMNHSYNDTLVDQLYRLNDNILEVMQMKFPKEVPVLKLSASQTTKQVGEQYQQDHLSRLGENAKELTFEGTHFIYHTNLQEVCEQTDAFISDVITSK